MSRKRLMSGLCFLGVGGPFLAIGLLAAVQLLRLVRSGVRTRAKIVAYETGADTEMPARYPVVEFRDHEGVVRRVQLARDAATGKDGRVESGMPVVAAVLIEPENDPKKVLRVTLPLGMSLQPGTRVIVDNGQPMTGPYVFCFNNGCMADYEASRELIGKLKKGQRLVIQGIDGEGHPISLVVPLQDFAKAYDGPPTDAKKFEEQQKQLAEELQKRAEEAHKKLKGQQPAPQSSVPPAPTR